MTNSNTDPRRAHFILLAKGLHDVGEGRQLSDRGRARITVAMVMAAQSVSADKDQYSALIRACQGLHADRKEQRDAYATAWAFFRDNVYDVIADANIKKRDHVVFDKVMSDKKDDEKLDSEDRARMNAPISARSQALMFGASVVVQFDAAAVDWNGVQQGKNGDVVVTDEANMKRLFANAKKDKSIANWQLKDYPIGTFGNFRFTTLAELGNDVMRQRNIKKAAPRRTADTTAMRDRLALVAKDLDQADAKSYDAPPDQSNALKAFVGIANALNDGTLKGVRFNNVAFSVIDWITEGAACEAEGKPVPPQYSALMQWASDFMDKNVAKKNGQPAKAAA